VKVLSARAEEIAEKKEFIHSFDYVLARAVAPIEDLLKWSSPFLKRKETEVKQNDHPDSGKEAIPAGSFIFWKGGDISQEIERAKLKYRPNNISVFPLTQEEGATADNPDKKIVIIRQ
jgi:16S rRNA (guanine527-N7)-methyltransferase